MTFLMNFYYEKDKKKITNTKTKQKTYRWRGRENQKYLGLKISNIASVKKWVSEISRKT